jgi:pimeloyl-ACP methyl ester carboxylesterase
MEQDIRFCATTAGERVAYMRRGAGPAILIPPAHVTAIAVDAVAPWISALADRHLVVRFDRLGCGLSDRDRTDFSLAPDLRALEAIANHLHLRQFSLLGVSGAGPLAVTYAVSHQRRLSHLVLYGTRAYLDPAAQELRSAMAALIRSHWGLGSKTLAELFMPGADAATSTRFAARQRESASAEVAARLFGETNNAVDVRELCADVRVPTLVLHREGDNVSPVELGRDLAARIPKARFVVFPGDSHSLAAGDWRPILDATEEFLAEKTVPRAEAGKTAVQPRSRSESAPTDKDDAARLVGDLASVTLSRYWVVPGYVRFDEQVRQALKDARHQIVAGLGASAPTRENHLIWAPPGSGKTYFVQRVAASVEAKFAYCEINLAAASRDEFSDGIARARREPPCLCFVDEIDAQPDESWPYETLLPLLDANTGDHPGIVTVLAGSGGADLAAMKAGIAARPKGADLLSRIPVANEYVVPPMASGDRLLAALTQIRRSATERRRAINAVDKLALYYLITQPSLANPRQLREAVVRGVERVAPSDDRLKYDHLFAAGDPENKSFWLAASATAELLSGHYLTVED